MTFYYLVKLNHATSLGEFSRNKMWGNGTLFYKSGHQMFQGTVFAEYLPIFVIDKGGRSANKFRQLQIRKLADLTFFRFADLPQMWQFPNLRFADPIFKICGFAICDLRICDLQTQIIFG